MRGGKRKGAGTPKTHPALKKEQVSFRLQHWIIEWLRSQPQSQSVLIEQALVKQYKLTSPEISKKI